MRFALLGAGSEAMQLVHAVQRDARHQLTAAAESALSPLAGNVPAADWESLLDQRVAEAVIVGQTDHPDRRADQLRQLVQAAVPMILVHPACEAIVGYELDMIRRDTECVMVPYCPLLMHPALDRLRQQVGPASELAIGPAEQLLFERHMTRRARGIVLYQLAQDALLIRWILGNVTQLTALGPSSGQADYANLHVHLSSPTGLVARWSATTTDQQPGARISLLGQAGKATVQLNETGDVHAWQIPGVRSDDEQILAWDGADSAIDSLLRGIAGREPQPSWDDACRAADLADTVDFSLRRGRTIDIHTQPCTEETTFKGIMAIGGCGALLFTLLAVFLLAIVESFDLAFLEHPVWQQYPWRLLYWRNWPYYLLGLLSLFLLLQLFRFLYPSSAGSDRQ